MVYIIYSSNNPARLLKCSLTTSSPQVALDLVSDTLVCWSGYISTTKLLCPVFNIQNCFKMKNIFGNTHSIKILWRSLKKGVMFSIPPNCSLWGITVLSSQFPCIIDLWIIIIPPFNTSLMHQWSPSQRSLKSGSPQVHDLLIFFFKLI